MHVTLPRLPIPGPSTFCGDNPSTLPLKETPVFRAPPGLSSAQVPLRPLLPGLPGHLGQQVFSLRIGPSEFSPGITGLRGQGSNAAARTSPGAEAYQVFDIISPHLPRV